MNKRHILAMCACALLGISTAACSANTSTASKQASKTVKVKKHQSNKKHSKKKSVKIAKKDKEKTDSKDKSQSEQEVKRQAQQKTQVSSNNQQSSSNQPQNQPNNNQQSQQPRGQQKSQGEINMERGYDPKGHPLLPGQDHAAGYNPDGSEDSWVKGQDEWLHRNGLINPDGSPTQKEKDIEAQNENDDFGEDIPDVPDPE